MPDIFKIISISSVLRIQGFLEKRKWGEETKCDKDSTRKMKMKRSSEVIQMVPKFETSAPWEVFAQVFVETIFEKDLDYDHNVMRPSGGLPRYKGLPEIRKAPCCLWKR